MFSFYFCPFRTVCNIVWVRSNPHASVQPWRGWHQNCISCVARPTVRLYKCFYTDCRHRRCWYSGGKVRPTDRREIGCRHLDCLWNGKALSLASTEYAFPSERPEHVVFLCFTHLAVAIRPRPSLERVSSLLGKPGSCTTKLLQHLCPLLRTPSSIWMLIRRISGRLREWQSLCMTRRALTTPSMKGEKNCSVSITEQWISCLLQRWQKYMQTFFRYNNGSLCDLFRKHPALADFPFF